MPCPGPARSGVRMGEAVVSYMICLRRQICGRVWTEPFNRRLSARLHRKIIVASPSIRAVGSPDSGRDKGSAGGPGAAKRAGARVPSAPSCFTPEAPQASSRQPVHVLRACTQRARPQQRSGGLSRRSLPPPVEAQRSGTVDEQEKEAADDRHVLPELDVVRG